MLRYLLLAVLLRPPSPSHWQRVKPFVRAAFTRMQTSARHDGLVMGVSSSWRSHREQALLHRRKPRLAARAGTSMHELGLAIDLSDRGRAVRRGSRMDHWLSDHVRRYHFTRPMRYEPWHIQWFGPIPPNVPLHRSHTKGKHR